MRCLLPIALVADAAVVPDDANVLMQVQHTARDPIESMLSSVDRESEELNPEQACGCVAPNTDCLPHDFTDWDFCGKQYTNSLAEPGSSPVEKKGRKEGYQIHHDDPGALRYNSAIKDDERIHEAHQELRYKKVTSDRMTGEELDLVVTVNAGSVFESYNCKDNGKPDQDVSSCFGQLNILTETSAEFTFQFQNQAGAPHVLRNFMFTVYDVDQEGEDDREFIHFVDAPTKYWTSNNTDDDNPSQIDQIDNLNKFESKVIGNAVDNPSRMDQLDIGHPLKRSKMISAQYNFMDHFRIRFGHRSPATKGRKFLFGGRVPTFGCPPSATTITTTLPPVCPDWTAATFNWDTCASGWSAMPSHNNLGGLGPNPFDPKEIRYDMVAHYGGYFLDLVVTNSTPYRANDISRNLIMNETTVNHVGASGCYGVVNVDHSSSVTLDFTFKYHGQDDGPTFTDADKFVFSLWDVDHSSAPGNQEKIVIPGDHIEGDLSVGEALASSHSNGQYVISSTIFGNGSDNPTDDLVASGDDVVSKRVAMLYKGTATWQVTLEAVAGKRGRNFMFYGCRT